MNPMIFDIDPERQNAQS